MRLEQLLESTLACGPAPLGVVEARTHEPEAAVRRMPERELGERDEIRPEHATELGQLELDGDQRERIFVGRLALLRVATRGHGGAAMHERAQVDLRPAEPPPPDLALGDEIADEQQPMLLLAPGRDAELDGDLDIAGRAGLAGGPTQPARDTLQRPQAQRARLEQIGQQLGLAGHAREQLVDRESDVLAGRGDAREIERLDEAGHVWTVARMHEEARKPRNRDAPCRSLRKNSLPHDRLRHGAYSATMRARANSLVLPLVLATLACAPTKGRLAEPTPPPQIEIQQGALVRALDVQLPMHEAAIVDLAFLVAPEGARWRLISADAAGFVRVFQDGKLLAATHAHRGGATALAVSDDGVPYTAGMDGRVIEWSREGTSVARVLVAKALPSPSPSAPEATMPRPAPRPIIALALAGGSVAFSDGHWVQVWSREATPRLMWSHHSRWFVSGLALMGDGSAIAMAQLRDDALVRGLAEHPAAQFPDQKRRKRLEADEYEFVRMQARADRPGAQADLVEVRGITSDWASVLEPITPIDPDLALPEQGLVVYREVYGPDETRVVGRSIGDRLHLGVRVGVIATPAGPDDLPAPEDPAIGLADFAFTQGVALDQPPVGVRLELFDGLPIAGRRELTIGAAYWAAGDEHGQIVIGPREGGPLEWLPASEPIELIAAAPHQPWLVSAGLEQPVRIRRWQLAKGEQRLVGMVLAPSPDPETGITPPALYPVELAVDDAGKRVVLSSWSFSQASASELRLFDLATNSSSVIAQSTSPDGISIALAAGGDALWSGYEGSRVRAYVGHPEGLVGTPWQAGELSVLGRPFVSSEGGYLGVASNTTMQIVDRTSMQVVQQLPRESPGSSDFVAAMSSQGLLAMVTPIGGGTIDRLHPSAPALPPIETFGPVSALAWLPNPAGAGQGDVLVIGQADGSIDLLGPQDEQPRPLRPAEGGRVWSLAAVGGSPGAFFELDDEGLWMHRIADGASLRIWLASPEPILSDGKASAVATSSAPGLVVVWRASSGAAACRVFDSTGAGVVVGKHVRLEQGTPTLLDDFLAGEVECGPLGPDPAPIVPLP